MYKTIELHIADNERVCANCRYYRQHYTKNYGMMVACYCGHCTYPRIKDKKPYDKCKNFEQGVSK